MPVTLNRVATVKISLNRKTRQAHYKLPEQSNYLARDLMLASGSDAVKKAARVCYGSTS
jgi:hypothetical protein